MVALDISSSNWPVFSNYTRFILSPITRVVLGKNDLMTPFEIRAQNLGVNGDWSTLSYGSPKKKFRAKNFFGRFLEKIFFDFYGHVGYQINSFGPLIPIKRPKKILIHFRGWFAETKKYEFDWILIKIKVLTPFDKKWIS